MWYYPPMDSPINYPVFAFKGKTYVLRFRLGAVYRLESRGINLATVGPELQSFAPQKDAEGNIIAPGQVKVKLLFDLLWAAMGDPDLTPEQIADEYEIADLAQIAALIAQAMGKVKPSQIQTPQTAAAPALN